MMGDTFSVVQEQAVREWRVSNAQMILRLEMLARGFAVTNSGEQMGPSWTVGNRIVETIEEGESTDLVVARPDENKAALIIQRRFRERHAKKKAGGGGGGGRR